MNLSTHATIRAKQRGISVRLLSIIEEYGRLENAPGGVQRIFFGRKEHQRLVTDLKRLIQESDRVRNCSVITEGGTIITVQHQCNRL